jgi:hypothetical protein
MAQKLEHISCMKRQMMECKREEIQWRFYNRMAQRRTVHHVNAAMRRMTPNCSIGFIMQKRRRIVSRACRRQIEENDDGDDGALHFAA